MRKCVLGVLISLLSAFSVYAVVPRVIIDTDLGSSMDDLWTIDFAARMHKAGKLDFMAVMMNRPDASDEETRGEFLKFADRYLATLGFADLPLGKSSDLAPDRLPQHVFNPYWTLIYTNDVSGASALMPVNRTDDQLAALANAVSLYRRLLNDASEKSVVICSIGFLNNLKALMESGIDHEGDGIDSTGIELIAAKVKELRIMGGCFDPATAPDGTGGAEYNLAGDPVAAKKVIEEWPTPVVMSPWEVGLNLDYKAEEVLADFPVGTPDPVLHAAYVYWPYPAGEGEMNRPWDLGTILPLTEGDTLIPLSEKGGISVDDKGVTTFTPNTSSNRCYQLASNMSTNEVLARFRAVFRTGNPSVTLLVSGKPEPGVDYNGSELVFKFMDFQLGGFSEGDLKFGFTVDGAEYAPESTEWDETPGILSVRFVIPADAVTAGNVYDGTLTVALENETLGTNVLTTAFRRLVQGALEGEKVNASLARIDGGGEYATVAGAVAAAEGNPIRLLHAASWSPTASDIGRPVRFLDKGLLVLDLSDLPFGTRPVWSGVDGNDGTLTLTRTYGDLTRLAPYLYEIWYDDFEDSDLSGGDAPFGDLPVNGFGGCSSVRVGNFHGRNLDIGISDLASIVVHVAASGNRFASVGTTQWSDVSETALANTAVSAHRFDVLPGWMLDGINEKGVAINVNVVPLDVPQEGADPESDVRPSMHARKVVRYVLDNAESAADAVEKLQGFRVYGNIGTGTYYLHWMISDPTTTYVVEIINGEVVAREHPIMTNFNLNWDNENGRAISDPENWGPETYFNPAVYAEDPDRILARYTPHADGIERYLMLRDAPYTEKGGTFEGMFDLLKSVRYTRIAYLPLEETYRSDLSEIEDANAAGFDQLTDVYAASNATKLAALWSTLRPAMTNVFEHLADYRRPDEIGEYSITTHNVTFDLAGRMFRIVVQEDYGRAFDIWLASPGVVPVTPAEPVVFETAEDATNVLKLAVIAPSAEVAEMFGGDADAKAAYCARFDPYVIPTSDGKWSVAALLKPADWTNVVESVKSATRQIPVADIAALPLDVPTNVTAKGCGVPGFYYSLYSGGSVTNLRAVVSEDGRNVLCGTDEEVSFSGVTKPSDDAGFFSVGVKETPGVGPSDRGIVVPGPVRIVPVR